MRFDAPHWDQMIEALKDADEIALACHVNPDGDALGALFGASLGLRQLGKKTWHSWPGAAKGVPNGYTFLPGSDDVTLPQDIPEPSLFLAVDCGAGHRLGDLEDKARATTTLVNLDHHPGNDEFGTINVVVPSASSTAELVAGVLGDLGVNLDTDIATCLYTGIFTDTGSFQYGNSSPTTMRLAADLIEIGVDHTKVAQHVLEASPYGFLQLVGIVLGRAQMFPQERFIYSVVLRKDLEATGVEMQDTDKLIDLLRSTKDADIAGIFKEQLDGTFRASFRSKGPVSVGEIARARGGGGHELAAGFTVPDVEAAVADIVKELGS